MLIDFSSPVGFTADPGIEFTEFGMRLVDPLGSEQAVYFKIDVNRIIAASAIFIADQIIWASVWSIEPSLDTVRTSSSIDLEELWSLLEGMSGEIYIGLVLGGIYASDQQIAPYNPVAYWGFEDGDLMESTGKSISMVGYSTEPAELSLGPGISVASGYLDIGNPPSLQLIGDLTLAMWIRPNTLGVRASILHKAYGGEFSITRETNGTLNFYYGTSGLDGSPYQGFNSAIAIQSGQEAHIAVVRDLSNSQLIWMIDRRITASSVALYNPATISSSSITLGTGYAGNFDGTVGNPVLYDKALDTTQVELLRSNTFVGEVYRSVGQMTIVSMDIEEENIWNIGNVISEAVYAYRGSATRDTLIRMDRIVAATSELSNVTLSVDRTELGYLIMNTQADYMDVILRASEKDNIFIHINDSFDADWTADDLIGSGLDMRTVSDVVGQGIHPNGSNRIIDIGGELQCNCSSDSDNLSFIVVLRKTSLDVADTASFLIKVGQRSIGFDIDDSTATINLGQSAVKPDFPWTTEYIAVRIECSATDTSIYVNDLLCSSLSTTIQTGSASITLIDADCECQIRSIYFGPLSKGIVEAVNPQIKIVTTGAIHCVGDLYLAGNKRMESIGRLHIEASNIYLDQVLIAQTPGVLLPDPVLLGITDAVTDIQTLFYGSKTENSIYRLEDGYWSLYEEARLFGIWRSLHTEGLLVQLIDESAIKIHLFKRTGNRLELNKYIALTGLPDEDYQFEPALDRRLSFKTCPWLWAKDTSLKGLA